MKHEYGPWLRVPLARRWPDRNKGGWGGDEHDKWDRSEKDSGGAKSSTRRIPGYTGQTTGEPPQRTSQMNPEFCGK